MAYGDEILFLRNKDGRFILYAVDMETGKVSTFCKDAACTHQASKCAAANVSANLEQYNGKLYAMDNNWKIMELKNGKFEQIADGQVNQSWHAHGNMYAPTRDGSLVVFENGSRKPRILIDEYSVYYSVVFGRYLYGSRPQTVTRVDLTAEEPEQEVIVQGSGYATIDGEHIYYVDEMTNHLYRCNMDGSSVELLEFPDF